MKARLRQSLAAVTVLGILALVQAAFSDHLVGVPDPTANSEAPVGGTTVVVRMVDFAFQPSEITVRPGDIVQFAQATATPHNVEFRTVPGGVDMRPAGPSTASGGTVRTSFPPPRMGPFLIEPGQTYEIVVTKDFRPGRYEFHCTPRRARGMVGVIRVERGATASK